MTALEPLPGMELNERPQSGDAARPQITASTILSAALDTLALHNVTAIPGRWKAMVGRQAKELLGDGFDPETILVAAVAALRRGEPHRMFWIAGDLSLAKGGALMSRDEYRSQIADAALRLSIPADEYQALYGARA